MNANKKKILVVTPRFPYPEAGADEQDRAGGLRQLKRLGYDLCVIAKYFSWQDAEKIRTVWGSEGIPVTLIPYQKRKMFSLILDRAAAEYRDRAMRRAVRHALLSWQPDLVWFDYTYLWPLYPLVRRRQIPIAVRSINVESRHFLEEEGRSVLNYIKFLPKYLTEETTSREADVLFSITPYEQTLYEEMGAKRVVNLPLRGLISLLGTHVPRETNELHVFFSGSTYTVAHNRHALEFIVREVAPAMKQTYGMNFLFHVTGAKFPDDVLAGAPDNVIVEGFVPDRDVFLQNMDIAISPSFFGGGMQQKVFEPLARGFPTITHSRAIAGYPFIPGEEYIAAETTADYCQALASLLSLPVRQRLSENARQKSATLFQTQSLDNVVANELRRLI